MDWAKTTARRDDNIFMSGDSVRLVLENWAKLNDISLVTIHKSNCFWETPKTWVVFFVIWWYLDGGCIGNSRSWKVRNGLSHDAVIKWKHFPRYWPFVRGIHRSTVNSPHKGMWSGFFMFSLICAWTNGCVNNRGAGDLRHTQANYGVTVITPGYLSRLLLS